MVRLGRLVFALLFLTALAGCGGSGGPVATEDEMKAHVEKYGDLSLDPAASSPLSDK